MKISVILPSYLGDYYGAAKDREAKLRRAINSFTTQDYADKELVVIADGCDKTMQLVSDWTLDNEKIKGVLKQMPKQEAFSGNVRNEGLKEATGDIICYLDGDDYFGNSSHLTAIVNGLINANSDWVYFDDAVKYFPVDHLDLQPRTAEIKHGHIGTSNIAHRNHKNITWGNCHGYGHDWTFIHQLDTLYPNHAKITGTSYVVCHIPGAVDN